MTLVQPRRLVVVFLLIVLVLSPRGTRAAGPPASTAIASAWLMVGHDPQRSQRSADIGPIHPRTLFVHRGMDGPPLIGSDGSVYSWNRSGARPRRAASP